MQHSCNRRKSKKGDKGSLHVLEDRQLLNDVQGTFTARSINQTESMDSVSLYGLMVISLKATSGMDYKMRWVASMYRRSTNCMRGGG